MLLVIEPGRPGCALGPRAVGTVCPGPPVGPYAPVTPVARLAPWIPLGLEPVGPLERNVAREVNIPAGESSRTVDVIDEESQRGSGIGGDNALHVVGRRSCKQPGPGHPPNTPGRSEW